ncbi:MAG: SGNH/GDSL hydrolase family protein [Armatimonadota bacterium]
MTLIRKCSLICAATLMAMLLTMSLKAAPLLKPGQRLVFLGDSITQQRIYTRYVMNYFTMRYSGSSFSFRNAGIGGDQASWAVDRIDRDVLSLKPDVVTILFGVNDVGYKPFTQEAFDAYIGSLKKMIEKLKKAHVQVVLLTPTVVDDDVNTGFKPFLNEALDRFRDGVLALAGEEKLPVYDLHALMMDIQTRAKADDPKFTMIPDSVHPNNAGHSLIALAMLKALGGIELPATLTVDASSKRITAVKCRLTNLRISTSSISFKRTDDALPTWFDANAAVIRKYIDLTNEINRYMFTVSGLSQGSWKLTVQDTVIGTFTSEALAAGVNLAAYDGPWMQMGKSVNAISQAQEDFYLNNWRVSRDQMPDTVLTPDQAATAKRQMDTLAALMEKTRLDATANRTWYWNLEKL